MLKTQLLEGFESYASPSFSAAVEGSLGQQYYFSGEIPNGVSFGVGLSGRGRSLSYAANNASSLTLYFPDGDDNQITGAVGFRFSGNDDYGYPLLTVVKSDGSEQFALQRVAGDTRLQLIRGGTFGPVVSRSNTLLQAGSIYRINMSVDMTANNVATVRVLINGQIDAGLTGVFNVQAQPTRGMGGIKLRSGSSSYLRGVGTDFDDIHFLTGGCEDREPVELLLLVPTADVVAQLSRSAGAANYANVDETPLNLNGDYNYGNDVGLRDLFDYSDLPIVPRTVYALGTILWAYKEESAARQLRSNVRIAGIDYNSLDFAMLEQYRKFTKVFDKNPANGNNFDAAILNNIQAGYEIRL